MYIVYKKFYESVFTCSVMDKFCHTTKNGEHTHLCHGDEVTEDFAKNPFLHEDGRGGERDGEEAHENVGDGQIGDEHVGHRLHLPVFANHVDDQSVARKTNHEDHRVTDDERRLNWVKRGIFFSFQFSLLANSLFPRFTVLE